MNRPMHSRPSIHAIRSTLQSVGRSVARRAGGKHHHRLHGKRLAALLCAALLLSLAGTGLASAATCRVTGGGTSTGTGPSWASPMDLQTALGTSTCTEIWVAQGVYYPVLPADTSNVTDAERKTSFNIQPGVAVYGGFGGGETNRSDRDPATYPTILSGDIDHNDTGSSNIDQTASDIVGSNSYHVVYMDGTTSAGTITASTVLDGFTITGGQANPNNSGNDNHGGGLYCDGSDSGHECSPRLSHITFSGNYADVFGGAMWNDGRYSGTSSPSLRSVTFSGNSALDGGAMYNDGEFSGTSRPSLSNVTFSGNSATHDGGAIYNNGSSSGTSSPILSNVILWSDMATTSGKEIYNGAGTGTAEPVIDHSVVQGSGGSGSGWDHSLGTDGGGNLDADPLLGTLGNHGGSTDTLVPASGNSAIDAGKTATCNDAATVNGLDQRGATRPQGSACDIGAVEVKQVTLNVLVTSLGSVSADASPPPIAGGIAGCVSLPNCNATYASGATVTLTASPDTGYHLNSWGGDCSGTSASASVTMDSDKTCTAVFVIDTYTLTYTADAHGSVTGPTPQTVNYGADGASVTAVPATGYHFTQWSDGVTTASRTDTNVSTDITVSAGFAIDTYPVTAGVSGGHGSITTPTQTIGYGSTASFTLIPDPHYHVASATGCGGTLTGNVYTTAPVTGPCTISVRFAQTIAPYAPVPTLDWRALLALAALLGLLAGVALRRQGLPRQRR